MEPTAVANTVKRLAFAHCGDLTFDDMVNAQIAVVDEMGVLVGRVGPTIDLTVPKPAT